MSWCQLLLDSVHVLDEMSEKSAFDLQHFRTGVDADHENDHNVRNLSPRKSKYGYKRRRNEENQYFVADPSWLDWCVVCVE